MEREIRATLFLKNGFKFSGIVLEEDETKLILLDKKIGRTEIQKADIAARSASAYA